MGAVQKARMQKSSATRGEEREEKRQEKGGFFFFSLDEVMGDGAPRAGAELVADAPLASHASTRACWETLRSRGMTSNVFPALKEL